MHRAPVHQHLAMQQAALLEAVVGHVLVLVRQHRPARQHGVAMLAVAGDGVGPVDHVVALGRQVIGLCLFGPKFEVCRLAAMHLAHLLQADDVGIKLLHRMAEVVDFQPAVGAQALHALVDVVGGDPDARHGVRPVPTAAGAKRGSIRMASAFDGE